MQPTPKKIVIITSGQPSTNPRAVKEADALAELGHEVLIIYQHRTYWASQSDKKLFKIKKWKSVLVGGHPKHSKLKYLITRATHGLAKKILVHFKITTKSAEWLIDRCTYALKREALRHPADLYIAHNLSAFPAAYAASKKFNVPYGVDLEDLHRFEISNNQEGIDYLVKKQIEDSYLSQADYATCSSPLIQSAYKEYYPELELGVILNTFPQSKPASKNECPADSPFKLFWFSQTVGLNRGLQDVFGALNTLSSLPIEFHILGSTNGPMRAFISKHQQKIQKNYKTKIILHPNIDAEDIIAFGKNFHVGIASEIGFSLNNELALSNKLFSYIQSGLPIIASNTPSQVDFLKRNQDIGMIYPINDAKALADCILAYMNDQNLYLKHKETIIRLGKEKYNWEIEKESFLTLIKKYLK